MGFIAEPPLLVVGTFSTQLYGQSKGKHDFFLDFFYLYLMGKILQVFFFLFFTFSFFFQLAIEAITNIRTVAGLGREKTFVRRYIQELEKPHQEAKKKSHIRGLVFGFAQSMPFFAYAGTMYYGGYLVDKKELEYQNVYK